MENTNQPNDIEYVYNQLLECVNKIYDKKYGLSVEQMKSFVNSFCNKINEDQKFMQLLLRKEIKLFKGISFTFIPKTKFEVIMNNTSEDHKELINQLWSNIYLLYLLGEAEQVEPNTKNMSKIAFQLDLMNGKISTSENESELPQLFSAFKDLNISDVEKMIGSVGISKEQMENIKSNIGIDLNDDKLKKLMSEYIKPPTENSNKFMSGILSDIKTKFNLNEDVSGKVNAKLFVDELLNVGNSIGDEYGKKIGSGELAVADIIGALTNVATNPDSNVISDITNTLKLDKIDMKEVIEELKERMNGKIPNELMDLLGNFDPSNIQNLDIGGLIGSMMSGQNQEIQELTDEQKKELLEYYNNMSI